MIHVHMLFDSNTHIYKHTQFWQIAITVTARKEKKEAGKDGHKDEQEAQD